MSEYHSQIGQDRFVVAALRGKREGTFLDVGCGHHQKINNTCYLEHELGWHGFAIDADPAFEQGWRDNRQRSTFICADAVSFCYEDLPLSGAVDYLSLDLEPPSLAWPALQKILKVARFRIITYEHDEYRIGPDIMSLSRELLKSQGYTLAVAGRQDDFWVDAALCGISEVKSDLTGQD